MGLRQLRKSLSAHNRENAQTKLNNLLTKRNIGRKQCELVKKKAARAQQVAQITINATLWKIIMQNADPDKPENDAILTVPQSELEGVPALFNLQVTQDGENILIKASVLEEKNIILPGDG